MPLTKVIPLPADSSIENKLEERRLWIGNLDSKVTEYQLLKLFEKHGRLEKFDLLFHRTGPLAGQPRGYAFVTYVSKEEAQDMMKIMDGKRIGSKNILVRWAHNVYREDYEKPKEKLEIPVLVGAKDEQKVSRITKIQAIEAKLKMMENTSSSEFQVNNVPSGSNISTSQTISSRTPHKSRIHNKPYSKR
uniref:Probable RNA-binding protein 18 n=1 Tax=Clastoptera arizonana TaxID=38151 RepID=A0A1B6E526_9HEMI